MLLRPSDETSITRRSAEGAAAKRAAEYVSAVEIEVPPSASSRGIGIRIWPSSSASAAPDTMVQGSTTFWLASSDHCTTVTAMRWRWPWQWPSSPLAA